MPGPQSNVGSAGAAAPDPADAHPAGGDGDSPQDVAESAAKHAAVDAGTAADAAANSSAASYEAASASAAVVRRARAATAAAVAAAAVAAAEVAMIAAGVVEDEAIARAIDVAASAVAALETVAAERPPGGDDDEADRAAAVVAAIVAAEVIAANQITAAAADTVATAVAAAAKSAATAARQAAIFIEHEAIEAARASDAVVDASAVTVVAADVVVESTKRVADLAARLRVVSALRDSEQRFRVTFDNAAAGMMLVSLARDDAGRLLKVNPALCSITGRADSELLEGTVVDFFAAGDRAEQQAAFAGLASGQTSAYEAEALWRHASGRDLWVHASLHAIREEHRPAYAVCQVADVTERRRADESLRRREERFRLAFDNAIIGMAFLRTDGTLRKVNSALCEFLGCSEKELVGQRLEMLACEDHQATIRAGIDAVITAEFTSYQAEHCFVHADGRIIWALISGSLEEDGDGRPDYLVFQLKDISARKEGEALLAHQAMHDELTGLPNRALLADHLTAACARAERAGTHLAVLFLDIDDFKEINDSLGHVSGDDVLIEVAARLRRCVRGYDIAARLGGDEFVVVCEGLQDPAGIDDVVARIDATLSAPMMVGPTELRLSLSVGINLASAAADPQDLLRGADTAMYYAKSSGKDRYEMYDAQMSVRATRHLTVGGELAHALARGELRLHYQPTYDLRTGVITGTEALLRWQHPTRGLLPPLEFLDIAEGRRMMIAIGDWVLETAAAQAARWLDEFGQHAPEMWVNISGQQLGHQHLIDVLERVLVATGLPAAKLGLEITERQLIGKEDSAQGDLIALRALGVRLAIDDFGTGFASYEYLRRFAFDEIKIDKSFVDGLGTDRTDTAVTTSVIALGGSLDLVVVAEGVETLAQYRELRALGCDLAQGYLMQRPATAEAIGELLTAGRPYVDR